MAFSAIKVGKIQELNAKHFMLEIENKIKKKMDSTKMLFMNLEEINQNTYEKILVSQGELWPHL